MVRHDLAVAGAAWRSWCARRKLRAASAQYLAAASHLKRIAREQRLIGAAARNALSHNARYRALAFSASFARIRTNAMLRGVSSHIARKACGIA